MVQRKRGVRLEEEMREIIIMAGKYKIKMCQHGQRSGLCNMNPRLDKK